MGGIIAMTPGVLSGDKIPHPRFTGLGSLARDGLADHLPNAPTADC